MNKSKICLLRGIVEPRLRLALLGTLFSIVLLLPSLALAGVQALFNLDVRSEAPFPTNWFSVPDASNNTSIRVNLPYPDCAVFVSDCEDLDVINTLDGFNLQPRLSIPLDGAIDVSSVTSESLFLISLGSTLDRGSDPPGTVVAINQVVWDPETNTLHVESDELLDQHSVWGLIVTRDILDQGGKRIKKNADFHNFINHVASSIPLEEYRRSLLLAIATSGVDRGQVAVAGVFTTQSVTAVMEKIRDQLKASDPTPAQFDLGFDGSRTVYARRDIASITFQQQIEVSPPEFRSVPFPLASHIDFIPDAVETIAFGKYQSPEYRDSDQVIPKVATLTGVPTVQGVVDVYFNLFIPSGPKPANGWPVAIHGHGLTVNKQGPTALAAVAVMASHGIAVLTINLVGHGFGPLGTLSVTLRGGKQVTLSAGGRGIDQDGDNTIGQTEGFFAAPPHTIVFDRDGQRQTAIDVMQLVRVIQMGIDIDGDDAADLDPSRIYYYGTSMGAMLGTMVMAIEPDIATGVLIVPGGSRIAWSRLSVANRPVIGTALSRRIPSLINIAGIEFDENIPLRHRPPVINEAKGALAIQEAFENQEWVSLSGDALGYVAHLRKDPLVGVIEKAIIINFAKGDTNVTNPTTSALIRAGDLESNTTFYRNDLAHKDNPSVPKNPHPYFNQITVPSLVSIARGAQEQVATLFDSDGQVVIHPTPTQYFEVPIIPPLPEELDFIP